jgi:hypothetical protein
VLTVLTVLTIYCPLHRRPSASCLYAD